MKENKPVFSLSDQALCLRREIRMRFAVYPGKVAKQGNNFSQEDMDREIGQMDAAADSLEKMAKNGLFRELYNVAGVARAHTLPELLAEIQHFSDQIEDALTNTTGKDVAIKLAGLSLRLAEAISELEQMPEKSSASAPVASAPASAPKATPATAVANNAVPLEQRATPAQRQELLDLLNSPAIPRNKKTQVLLNINVVHTDKAAQLILELKKKIEDHEGPIVYRQAS